MILEILKKKKSYPEKKRTKRYTLQIAKKMVVLCLKSLKLALMFLCSIRLGHSHKCMSFSIFIKTLFFKFDFAGRPFYYLSSQSLFKPFAGDCNHTGCQWRRTCSYTTRIQHQWGWYVRQGRRGHRCLWPWWTRQPQLHLCHREFTAIRFVPVHLISLKTI